MYRNVAEIVRYAKHCKHVPHQRALELRPDHPPVRIRGQPEELPGSAEVQDRKQARGHDRKHGHHLGTAIDRGTESGAKQIQNRGDQRARVSDTDPEDEADDVDRPHHGWRQPRDTQTPVDLVHPRDRADDHAMNRIATYTKHASQPAVSDASSR